MSGATIGAAVDDPRKVMASRLRKVLIGAPLGVLALGSVATQVTAWKLGYHAALGAPVFAHVYWPWEYLTWRSASWAPNAVQALGLGKQAAGSTAGLGMALVAVAGSHKKPKKHDDVHGTARFASQKEVRDARLLPSRIGDEHPGLYVGAWTHRNGSLEYLRHRGAQHILGVGPMRSGKTHGLVVPNLLSWGGSALIYDPKGELWGFTAGWRALEGKNRVIHWEIAAIDGTASYNFIEDCVRLGTDHEYADMASLIEAVVDPTGAGLEGHFDPTAAAMLTGIALHVSYEKRAAGKVACLADVLHALSDPDRKPDALYKSMVENRHVHGVRHDLIARTGTSMASKDAKERSGVLSTCERMLRQLNDPILARNTSRCDFRIRDLMDADRPVSLYITLKDKDRLRLRPMLRLFMTRMMDELCSVDMKPGQEAHRHKLLLMMDEFPSLGRMDTFVSSLARCPGYGIRAFLLVQDRNQLVLEYTKDETVSAMCHIRVSYAPNSLPTAEWVAEMAGTATVNKEDVSESGGSGSKTTSSRSFHTVSRKLLNPDEVMRLKQPIYDGDKVIAPGHSLVMMAGELPIMATQSLYFLDPEFLRRQGLTPPLLPGTKVAP